MKCKFCDNEATAHSGVYVCNNCHTVCFSENILPTKKCDVILNYLSDIQAKVLKQQTYLHAIEQKHILGHDLTPDEEEIRKNMSEFQDIRLELNTRIANDSSLNEKIERELLYRLLTLSERLSNFFERDIS